MKPIVADADAISHAADLLRQGRLVAFPTETVYGLGADASNPVAVAAIFKAKGRPADHPLIVHIADIDSLYDWASTVPDAALTLAHRFWPGPLAMILNKKPEVPLAVTGGQQTVGLRMPDHPVALALLKSFGGGVAAPSANRFCRISPTQAVHVSEELGDAVDMILDGGTCQVGVESTIIDLSGSKPRLLRPGHITRQEIEAVLQTELLIPPASKPAEIRAPGMMAVHYAPTTPAMRCPAEQLPDRMQKLVADGKRIGLLSYQLQIPETGQIRVLRLPKQASDYAQRLYAALRELDSLQLDLILVEQPPQTESWRAINDRLSKATVASATAPCVA
ncbi:MAG: L-threonylcarbamoyladenylate synthase [Methylobacter sp.]|uniref:L-threonylcarbamoyladenylate synthase n=1 Tax=Methylobacter sp. TaxID=2051955 RepID=UPI0027304DBD|nr:L-threonylcarbamoyladenylate synthase [Methylobacter sp.]MDP1664210.1 L-threonylcarbamoyladenylate synthase [Methylobacter sp.]MDP1969543.1 L-threonylcarbamoyladenylate synthase [Methylobacter sp.]